MSDVTSIVTKVIQNKGNNNNFEKVLIDVAKAFGNRGFFQRENWREILNENFHPNHGSGLPPLKAKSSTAIENKNARKDAAVSSTLPPIATRTRRRTLDHNAEHLQTTPNTVQKKHRLNKMENKSKTPLNKTKPTYNSPTRRSLRLHTSLY